MEGGESSQVSDSEGSGEPPKKGDICIDECGQAQVFDGNGWVEWRPKVTGVGQLTPVDGPADWIIGIWKTPFQAADDVAVLGFAKFAGGSGKRVFIKGVGEISSDLFHRSIKPKILKSATNYSKAVGDNPNIIINNGKIFLQGTGKFSNFKLFNTGLDASDFF